MALFKIDMTKYFKLVQQEKEFQSQGKRFFQEDRKAALELAGYRVIFKNEVSFRQRFQYLELIQNFLDEKMDGHDFDFDSSFYWSFYEMCERDRDQVNVLEQDFLQKNEPILETDSRADSFSDLIHFIFSAGESFTDTKMTDNDETNYRNEVKQYFLEMQELLEED